jgi:tetratricopeptide (TPR) repeat protein
VIELKSPPSLYNQSLQGDEEFVANFVARRQVLDTLCRRLEVSGAESDSQHQILIGSRGMGKTSLLRRLAIEIDRSPKLSARFIPLMFREEQYNVLHLRDFWQNCGEALAEWAEAHGDDNLAARLDDAICSETWADDEGAADQFLAAMNALGKRAVLMVDNLDLIIDALKDSDRWTLRGSLQMRGGPIVIGAATHSLRESANREAAFYEFFQQSYLEPLSLPETETCMRALASGRGELGRRVVTILNSDRARLKVLHRLTGGNPRVLALTYRFLETTDTNDAMGDLERLLDEVTPYYKARVEEYQTPLQRATIDAIALHWDPVTTGELSKIMGVPSTTLSPQLSRLRKDGLIESTETSGSYAGHQISERFLNIWYLMRHGTRRNKQRMRWLVAFLSSFYSSNDLDVMDREARASGLAARWTKDYAEAFEQAKQRAALGLSDKLRPVMQKSEKIGKDAEEPTTQVDQAKAMINTGVILGQSGDAAAEIEAYEAVVARFGDSAEPELKEPVARAMLYKGLTLGESGDVAGAIETYDAVVARFDDSTDREIKQRVATAMFCKGLTLGESGNVAGEIEMYDAIVLRFDDSTEPEIKEQVATALVNKGISLGQSGDATGEIEAYDAVVARFDDSTEPEIKERVARAMINKGIALSQSGDAAAAVKTYFAVVERFGDNAELELKEQVAMAMVYKGFCLGESGDPTAAVEAYDAVVARFGDSAEPELKKQVATAMFNKAHTFSESGDAAAAIESYDALVARFGDSAEPELKKDVASAMVNKGLIPSQSGDAAAAVEVWDAIVARFGDSAEPELKEPVAVAMFYKGVNLGKIGNLAGEITCYEQALALMQGIDSESASQEISSIVTRLGNLLFDGIGDCERFEALFLQAAEHSPLPAYANLFWLYISSGRTEKAKQTIGKLDKFPPLGRLLIDAAFAFDAENFGEATGYLHEALSGDPSAGDIDFTDDLERLVRIAIAKGFGERLIGWFEKTRFAERYAPVHVAMLAAVRGERMLLDSNPEVRDAASEIYARLVGSKRPGKGK